jgi:hypothetical protein
LTRIQPKAFSQSRLTPVDIPRNVQFIAASALAVEKSDSIFSEAANTISEVLNRFLLDP